MINTTSFLAVMGAATSQMAYSAAKAAVLQLSRDLGTHLARRGVRVNAQWPTIASDDAGFVIASAFPIEGGITAAFTVPS